MRGFRRVVVGDVTNAAGNEKPLAEKGIYVDILENRDGMELYAHFRAEKPDQELEDWQGLSAVKHRHKK